MWFNRFVDCVDYVKKSTYLIARWNNMDWCIQWETLWTWVIVSGKKMLTCAHVINWWQWHVDQLSYCFIRHDELDNIHASIFNLELWKNLFIYEKYDLAVIEINRWFYQSWEKIYKDESECLTINSDIQNIWTEIGVMWYPLSSLSVIQGNWLSINVENVIIRVDKWVINWKYKRDGIYYDEFTVQFNPWNSWGPIFSAYDWTLLWLVKGYRNIPSKINVCDERVLEWENKKEKILSINTPYYSIWIPVENYFDILKNHLII